MKKSNIEIRRQKNSIFPTNNFPAQKPTEEAAQNK